MQGNTAIANILKMENTDYPVLLPRKHVDRGGRHRRHRTHHVPYRAHHGQHGRRLHPCDQWAQDRSGGNPVRARYRKCLRRNRPRLCGIHADLDFTRRHGAGPAGPVPGLRRHERLCRGDQMVGPDQPCPPDPGDDAPRLYGVAFRQGQPRDGASPGRRGQ